MSRFAKTTLSRYLTRRGIGPSSLAEGAQVGRSSVWRWVKHGVMPRVEQANLVAIYLGIEVEDVLAMVRATAASGTAAPRRAPRARSESSAAT